MSCLDVCMHLLIKQEQLKFKTGLKMAAGLLHDIVLFTFSYVCSKIQLAVNNK